MNASKMPGVTSTDHVLSKEVGKRVQITNLITATLLVFLALVSFLILQNTELTKTQLGPYKLVANAM